jgi:hypothetical protein
MVIKPVHDDLDDIVQDLQGDRGRHLDLSPDQRFAAQKFDPNRSDLMEGVGRGPGFGINFSVAHAANLKDAARQFHGSSSSILLMG